MGDLLREGEGVVEWLRVRHMDAQEEVVRSLVRAVSLGAREIVCLDGDIAELRAENARLAARCAQLEAALVEIKSKGTTTGWNRATLAGIAGRALSSPPSAALEAVRKVQAEMRSYLDSDDADMEEMRKEAREADHEFCEPDGPCQCGACKAIRPWVAALAAHFGEGK